MKGIPVIDQEILVRSISEATAEVFQTMLGMEIRLAGHVADSRPSESGLISLVGVTGDWGGSGVFCCTASFAALLCSRMLGTDLDESRPVIDDEVLDVVAEVTNMMVGNIKNGLEDVTGPLAISVPTVVHGRNFQFRNVAGLRGAALLFETEGHKFEVRISLAPVEEHAVVRMRIPVLGLAHV